MTKSEEAERHSQDLSLSKSSSERPGGGSQPRPVREKWASRQDFYLSCAGGFIGLGNVWRFPYLCYENGGAIFFIPYLVALFAAGIPVFFAEVVVGQYTSEGGITAWQILAPITTGIGFGSIVLTCVINTYYIVVLAWALYYFIQSFRSADALHVMWNSCNNTWNSEYCKTVSSVRLDADLMATINDKNKTFMTPIEEYWENHAIKIGDHMEWNDLTQDINWNMFYCVLVSWIVCYFCVWKGIGWTGKVVVFTATFPVFMLFVLLIRGLTLPGAMKGVEFYLVPSWEDLILLKSTKIWIDATSQVLFSYALCKGALTSLGSYNKFRTNCYKDVFYLSCCNSGMSLVSGFAIFGVLGFMAEQFGVEVKDVAKSGPGLAFMAFPQAILEMPGKQFQPLWAIAFFFMIFLLGLDTQFVGLEAMSTSILDMMPNMRNKKGFRELLILTIVTISALIAIPMCAPGGLYLFKLFDYYGASGFVLLFLSSCQVLAISYIYGAEKMWRNVTEMIGFSPGYPMLICWKFITPALCIGMIFMKVAAFENLVYPRPMNKDYTYSSGEEAVGWFLASLSMIPVVAVAIFYALVQDGKLAKSWSDIVANVKNAMQPRDQYIQYIVYRMKRNPESLQGSLTSIYSECEVNELDPEKIPIELKQMANDSANKV